MTDNVPDIEINLTVEDLSGERRTFPTTREMSDFIESENENWQREFGKFSIAPIKQISNAWTQARQTVVTFKNSYPKLPEPERVKDLKKTKNTLTENLKNVCFSTSPFTAFFLNVCKLGSAQATSFWESITSGHIRLGQGPIDVKQLEGIILAYEYRYREKTYLFSRRESEERSVATLRRELTDKNDKFVAKSDAMVREFSEKTEKLITDFSNQVSSVRNDYKTWQTEQEQQLTTQRTEIEDKSSTFFAEAKKKISELEQLYTEKLRLEAPAEHWRNKAKELRRSGFWWGGILIFSTVAAVGLFVWLFNNWLTSGEMAEPFSTRHWQGIILLLSVLSLVAFLLRTFGRLTFSAFHLQRDAEEREQLAHVYLAIAKDTTISDDARRVVMQSLFSRTDSGLLPGDHGPTMPNVTELASNFAKK
jgi:hypothetical protein